MSARAWRRLSFVVLGASSGLAATQVVINFQRGRIFGVLVNLFSLAVTAIVIGLSWKVHKWQTQDQREHEAAMARIDRATKELEGEDPP